MKKVNKCFKDIGLRKFFRRFFEGKKKKLMKVVFKLSLNDPLTNTLSP